MKKVRVAVFPAGTEIGLEICNALKYEKNVELVGLNSVLDHSEMLFKNMILVPFYTDFGFVSELNKVIQTNAIDYIYPAYDDVLLFMTQKQNEIKAKIVTSPLTTIEITRSKRKTYEHLKKQKFIPKMYRKIEEIKEYPVFVKPDIGQGSFGAKKIRTEQELLTVDNLADMVITEYLPGEELTVDCFTNDTGELVSYIPRKRLRIRNGIAVRSELAEMTDEIFAIADELNHIFEFSGAWFFQIKKDKDGKYKLLEIAARIAGTMGLTRNLGINYPMLTLYMHMGIPVSVQKNNYDILVDRALMSRYNLDIEYEYVYVDLDDTLILNGEVNCIMMLYLYQCINHNKHIYLLTRHQGDVEEYLGKFKISSIIFEKIITMGENESKSCYIEHANGIFIDDSFKERISVKEECKIPVFGIDNIESLIEWK